MSSPSTASYVFRIGLTVYANDPLGYGSRLPFTADQVEPLPLRDDGSRRFLCSVEDLPAWPAALLPDGKGDFFIIVNKARTKRMRSAGYALDALKVTLVPDTSEYGMPMPEELGELLLLDEEASKYFHALTPGKQRALIYQVAKPKREATRLRKAVGITEYLKVVRGKLDFAELNAYVKEMGGG